MGGPGDDAGHGPALGDGDELAGETLLAVEVDETVPHADRLAAAAVAALKVGGAVAAQLELAVVHDAEMHALNVRWLKHDYTTDVLSFPLGGAGTPGDPLSGQVIVNPDYAFREAAGHAWPPHELSADLRELMLYVAHGTLHVCGFDDQTDAQLSEMRAAEAAALAACDVAVPPGHGSPGGDGGSGVSEGQRSG
ncbi:rRNA maturation RNase YbeY [Alienimonas californiensis]|uniref:Endoribonuclease YbeY n=1 Tax=Alienimonas californiensis TaxID=2527989 RepID=A0A517PFP2_9PLAN|nr:rRNA maturation RNase YbeY [Alienimonas californiensis]QDT18181.1 Endoribonuclease YbeY [Alienimonas californiensis]